MAYTKHQQLIARLHEQSVSNRVKWKVTMDDAVFQVVFPRFTVQIRKRLREVQGMLQRNVFFLDIFSSDGVRIEEIIVYGTSGLPEARHAAEIYDMARRQALGRIGRLMSCWRIWDSGRRRAAL